VSLRLGWIAACCASTAGCLFAPARPAGDGEDGSVPDGGAGGLAQVAYIKTGAPSMGDRAGYAVALSGDGLTLAVGVPDEDGSGQEIDAPVDEATMNAGAVYVYAYDGLRWTQQAYVKPGGTVAGLRFGSAAALSANGNTLVVGAPGVSNDTGIAYTFVRTGTSWSQQGVLINLVGDEGDRFGASVAVSADGSIAVVGAPSEDSNSETVTTDNMAMDAGAAFVFERSGQAWGMPTYIKDSVIGAGDQFGSSVAIAGDGATLAVGSLGDDTGGATNGGAMVVFIRQPGWALQATLQETPGQDSRNLGNAIALSGTGDLALTGAVGDAGDADGFDGSDIGSRLRSGAAYLHGRVGTPGPKTASVEASNPGLNDLFATSVALSRDATTFLAGAGFESSNATGIDGAQDNDDAPNAGAAYLFTAEAPRQQLAYVKASNALAGDSFGFAVAISDDGGTFAVGAPLEDGGASGVNGDQAPDATASNSGAVYVFRR